MSFYENSSIHPSDELFLQNDNTNQTKGIIMIKSIGIGVYLAFSCSFGTPENDFGYLDNGLQRGVNPEETKKGGA